MQIWQWGYLKQNQWDQFSVYLYVTNSPQTGKDQAVIVLYIQVYKSWIDAYITEKLLHQNSCNH